MLQVNETYINRTENYLAGSDGWYAPYTDDLGELFRAYQRDFGRCTGNMYHDAPCGTSHKIGWVFLKRKQYDDCEETYLQETWVHYKHVA